MRIRIPEIIYQTMASLPDCTEEGKQVYTALADAIRDDQRIENRIDNRDRLGILFYSQYQRAQYHQWTWHSIPWWFAENYEFVCLNQIQKQTKRENQPTDPFFYLKQKALETAISLFPPLVKPLLVETRKHTSLTKEVFTQALLRILWGNKADLSMSGGKVNQNEIKSESSNLLLIDAMDDVWEFLEKRTLKRMIVCADNTGLEILCDFALIAILLFYFPQLTIQYVIKDRPVFVSDVTPADIPPTLKALQTSQEKGSV